MRRLVTALTCLGLAGCVQLAQPAPHIERYILDYSAPRLGLAELPLVLRIDDVGVAATYDREPIVYRNDPLRTDSYHYHRWAASPGALIHDALVRDLASSGIYRGVQPALGIVPADYALSIYIDAIDEQPADSGCKAVLAARVSVVRQQAPKPAAYIAVFPYSFEEPVACNQPHALVEALSRNLQRLSEALQQDLHRVLAAQ
jgi:uncharacterized lipoprotein YmbA